MKEVVLAGADSSDSRVVTVVIPTYRRPDMVVRAVRSVLHQTYPHVRVRVFDNASGDDTARVVRELADADARVEYFEHSGNIGAAANFGFAIAHVDTPWFVALSDDDLILPRFLEGGLAMLSRYPRAHFHCARSIVFNELAGGVRVHGGSWEPGLHEPEAAATKHMLREHFITTGVLFRTSVRDTVGDFAQYPVEREFVARAAALHPFTVTGEIGGVLAVHERSFSAGVKTKGTDPSRLVGVVYARQCLFSALTNVVSIPSFSDRERAELFQVAMENARRDTIYHLLVKGLPRGEWEQVDEVLLLAKWLGFGSVQRAGLRLLRLMGRIPLLSRILVSMAGLLARRITRTAYEPFDSSVHRDIVDYVRSGATRLPR